MKRIIAVVIAAFLALSTVSAQYKPASPAWNPAASYTDFRVGIGFRIPMGGSSASAGVGYDFSYGSFSPSGFGWRAGLLYMSENMDIPGHIGFPLAVAYRSGLRNTSLLGAGMNVASGAIYDGMYGRTPTRESMLMDFLAGLFSRGELAVGITPGFITGNPSPDSEIELNSKFFASIDATYTAMWRLGHFNLCLAPGLHYYLTDSFRELDTEYVDPIGVVVREVSTIHWQFSLSASLGYSF